MQGWESFKFFPARIERLCGRLYFPKMTQDLPYHMLFYNVSCYTHIKKESLIFFSFLLFFHLGRFAVSTNWTRWWYCIDFEARLEKLCSFQIALSTTTFPSAPTWRHEMGLLWSADRGGRSQGWVTDGSHHKWTVLHYSPSRGSPEKQWWGETFIMDRASMHLSFSCKKR